MTGGASPRRRGDYFERQCKRDLEAHGWLVIRAGGSLGPADLVAIGNGKLPLLVSCKLNGRISPQERNLLAMIGNRFGASVCVASRPRNGMVLYRGLRPDDDPTTITR
jgi:Holliday junction resolvase